MFKIPLKEFSRLFADLLFVFLLSCVKHSFDVLDPENQPGFGSGKIRTGSESKALVLTEDV